MSFRPGGVLTILAVLTLAVAPAWAGKRKKKRKKKAPAAPVAVTVENGCKAEADIKLGQLSFKVAPGAKSAEQAIQGGTFENTENVYELLLSGKSLGLYTLEGGGRYEVRLADCRGGHADVYTHFMGDRPKGKSPNAAAQVRFRARQNVHLEYRSGTRFKPLSVAMTRYQEIAGGDFEFTFRLRAAKRGPVLKMMKKSVKLKAGHHYLIEANVTGREITFKVEDEGFEGT